VREKTTLLRTIMGPIPVLLAIPRWLVGTRRVNQPGNMAAKGAALIPEGRMIFRDMTIEENLMMGAFAKPCRHAVRTHLERVYELFPLLRERSPHQAGTLSGGQAQMLAMGRGLISDPKVLLIERALARTFARYGARGVRYSETAEVRRPHDLAGRAEHAYSAGCRRSCVSDARRQSDIIEARRRSELDAVPRPVFFSLTSTRRPARVVSTLLRRWKKNEQPVHLSPSSRPDRMTA
jgi:hypothetical protein